MFTEVILSPGCLSDHHLEVVLESGQTLAFDLPRFSRVLRCGGKPTNDIGTVTLPNGAGTTTAWPHSLGFVHTLETPDGSGVHQLSDALKNVFLPDRKRFMVDDVLSQAVCTCEQRFPHFTPPLLEKAVRIRDEITQSFAQRFARQGEVLTRLKAKPASAARTREVAKARASLAALERDREQAVLKAAKAQGIVLPPLDRTVAPQVLQLGLDGVADGDPKRVAALRQAAVMDLLRSEPARRTVTGSFRVH